MKISTIFLFALIGTTIALSAPGGNGDGKGEGKGERKGDGKGGLLDDAVKAADKITDTVTDTADTVTDTADDAMDQVAGQRPLPCEDECADADNADACFATCIEAFCDANPDACDENGPKGPAEKPAQGPAEKPAQETAEKPAQGSAEKGPKGPAQKPPKGPQCKVQCHQGNEDSEACADCFEGWCTDNEEDCVAFFVNHADKIAKECAGAIKRCDEDDDDKACFMAEEHCNAPAAAVDAETAPATETTLVKDAAEKPPKGPQCKEQCDPEETEECVGCYAAWCGNNEKKCAGWFKSNHGALETVCAFAQAEADEQDDCDTAGDKPAHCHMAHQCAEAHQANQAAQSSRKFLVRQK